MKKLLLLIVALLATCSTFAQSTLSGQNSGNQLWIKLGSLALPQGGSDCLLRIVGGTGYNASKYQQGYIELHLRTSNGVSVDENGYGFSATAVSFERARFISEIRIVPNASGAGATAYSIYVNCAPYPGNTFFTVEDPTGTWTTALSNSSSSPGGYNVPFEHLINNDTFVSGNMGVGTTDARGYRLAVAGSVIAESVTVKLQSQWPDFVFTPSYQLPSLSSVLSFIHQYGHLPELPSAQEVKEHGIDVGKLLELQTQKIEELTLYLLKKDKQLAAQNKRLMRLEAVVTQPAKKSRKRH